MESNILFTINFVGTGEKYFCYEKCFFRLHQMKTEVKLIKKNIIIYSELNRYYPQKIVGLNANKVGKQIFLNI